jgi:hypothetical protein
MYGANRLALGIFLAWIAGFLFFFAFHPGGVEIKDPNMNGGKGGSRGVRNPAEILGYLMSAQFGAK